MKFFELQRELDKCHNGIWSSVGSIREAVCKPNDFAFILTDQRIRLEAYIDRTIALLDHGVSIPEACPNYWIENRTHILTGLLAMKETLEVELNWRAAELKGSCNFLLAEADSVLGVLRMLVDSPFSSANEGVDHAKKGASIGGGGRRVGRPPGKSKLSAFEKECIRWHSDGKKPAEIDQIMMKRSGAVREDGTAWAEGTAELVMRAHRKRTKNVTK